MTKIELCFSNSEMIDLLRKNKFEVVSEQRNFYDYHLYSDNPEEIVRDVYVVYKLGGFSPEEILVADEKNYLSKSSVLKEQFQNILKNNLLGVKQENEFVAYKEELLQYNPNKEYRRKNFEYEIQNITQKLKQLLSEEDFKKFLKEQKRIDKIRKKDKELIAINTDIFMNKQNKI